MNKVRNTMLSLLRNCMVLSVALSLPVAVEADCVGAMRDTTAAEKSTYDWADIEFPKLIQASDDYVRGKSDISVSRHLRCVDREGDPLYIGSHVTFLLHGEAERRLKVEEKELMDSFQVLTKRIQEMQKSGMDITTVMAQIESEQKQFERKSNAFAARRTIKVDAYFNNASAECQGMTVKVPGAFAGCRLMGDDEREHIRLLFGPWRKSETGQWSYEGKHDLSVPTERIQTLEITMSGTPEALNSVIERSDWSTVLGRLGK